MNYDTRNCQQQQNARRDETVDQAIGVMASEWYDQKHEKCTTKRGKRANTRNEKKSDTRCTFDIHDNITTEETPHFYPYNYTTLIKSRQEETFHTYTLFLDRDILPMATQSH